MVFALSGVQQVLFWGDELLGPSYFQGWYDMKFQRQRVMKAHFAYREISWVRNGAPYKWPKNFTGFPEVILSCI